MPPVPMHSPGWALAGLASILLAGPAAAAPTETVLFRFAGPNGMMPAANLVVGAGGGLFGTTASGGAYSSGTVFRLVPPAAAGKNWSIEQLHQFCPPSSCDDGAGPAAGLIPDGAGGFFGTAQRGGAHGVGTVFRLSPPAKGQTTWQFSVVYAFCPATNCPDGRYPTAGLVRDSSGALYGTANEGGGAGNWGTVFELTPPAAGGTGWSETTLHTFGFADGAHPFSAVALGADGSVFATASEGGSHGYGTVVRIAQSSGAWKAAVIHEFCAFQVGGSCIDGATPQAGVIAAANGDLYGTTSAGGSEGWGTVFRLVGNAGVWAYDVIHNFGFGDGAGPAASLIPGPDGSLFGTTASDGTRGYGTVFKLSPAGALWRETVLHDFAGGGDGESPRAPVALDAAGELYGTTMAGGALNFGTVYRIAP